MLIKPKRDKLLDNALKNLRGLFNEYGYGKFVEIRSMHNPENILADFCGYILVGVRYGIALHHTEDGMLQYTTFIWPARAKQSWYDIMQKGVPEKWVVHRITPPKDSTLGWIVVWIFQDLSLDTYNNAPLAEDFIRDLFASDLTAVGIAKRMKQYKLLPDISFNNFVLDVLAKAMNKTLKDM